jgi:hypothetical protein
MQPYERPRTGMLAGTVGSRAPLLRTETPGAFTVTPEGYVRQAPAPPTFARAYEIESAQTPQPISPAVPIVGMMGTPAPATVAAPGTVRQPRPAATSGRVTMAGAGAARPRGTATVWLDYDGSRWTAAGPAHERTGDMIAVGNYRGFPVYQRGNDTTTIYVASVPGLFVPYRRR